MAPHSLPILTAYQLKDGNYRVYTDEPVDTDERAIIFVPTTTHEALFGFKDQGYKVYMNYHTESITPINNTAMPLYPHVTSIIVEVDTFLLKPLAEAKALLRDYFTIRSVRLQLLQEIVTKVLVGKLDFCNGSKRPATHLLMMLLRFGVTVLKVRAMAIDVSFVAIFKADLVPVLDWAAALKEKKKVLGMFGVHMADAKILELVNALDL